MLRRVPIDCLGICTELKGIGGRNYWGIRVEVVRTRVALLGNYWGLRGKLLGNSCRSSANSCGITGELVGTSWEMIREFVWK